jgi:hypothetical protein
MRLDVLEIRLDGTYEKKSISRLHEYDRRSQPSPSLPTWARTAFQHTARLRSHLLSGQKSTLPPPLCGDDVD